MTKLERSSTINSTGRMGFPEDKLPLLSCLVLKEKKRFEDIKIAKTNTTRK